LVLAYSALETIIAVALDHLITTTTNSPELWEWINNRGFFLKNPSVEEQYTVLLKILTGKSLREETALWKAFTDLHKIRNKIAHTGKAILNKKEADNQVAGQLIGGAKEIINWLEKLLPEHMRRPKHDAEMQISFTKLLSK
jgi:hypothetical protein